MEINEVDFSPTQVTAVFSPPPAPSSTLHLQRGKLRFPAGSQSGWNSMPADEPLPPRSRSRNMAFVPSTAPKCMAVRPLRRPDGGHFNYCCTAFRRCGRPSASRGRRCGWCPVGGFSYEMFCFPPAAAWGAGGSTGHPAESGVTGKVCVQPFHFPDKGGFRFRSSISRALPQKGHSAPR